MIDSSTTIDASTTMPMPSARPPSDMMFSETLNRYIGANVTTIEIGIEIEMISVGRKLRSASQITNIVRIIASQPELLTSDTESRMNVDWSESTSKRACFL